MKKFGIFLSSFLVLGMSGIAQVGITDDNTPPDPSAMLDVKSTTKGALLPRMTLAQISAISGPVDGLVVYCSSDSKFYAYNLSANTWKEILYGAGTIAPCGYAFTITHVAGTVAPVDKTVTYGTVSNVPGEPAKCWISKNLGATRRAISTSDNSEESAGWYWQFNRKQGYQYYFERVPNTTWITSIVESSDWVAANDPCSIELGSGWRIPTSTEWTNVVAGGGWTIYTGPYYSNLRLHVAGYLNLSNGGLVSRGFVGVYWSGTPNFDNGGWNLYFDGGNCSVFGSLKATAYPLRCLRN